MKTSSRRDELLFLAVISGLVLAGLTLFATILCFQTSPDEIRANWELLDGRVVRKIESKVTFKDASNFYHYLDVEIVGDATESSRVRIQIGWEPYSQFREGEFVPVYRRGKAYRVDRYGAMDTVSPLPFFAVAGGVLVLFVVLIRKCGVLDRSRV